jgi:osmotically-inducible protein OsmY
VQEGNIMSVYNWKWLSAAGLALALATPTVAVAQSRSPASGRVAVAAGENANPQAAADHALTAQIKERLQKNRLFKQADVYVKTNGAIVTLAGSVPSETARSEAVDLARSTPGVLAVDDELRVLISSPDAPAPER